MLGQHYPVLHKESTELPPKHPRWTFDMNKRNNTRPGKKKGGCLWQRLSEDHGLSVAEKMRSL